MLKSFLGVNGDYSLTLKAYSGRPEIYHKNGDPKF